MTSSMSKFYIDEIINSLVQEHASVLVGAGFSKNADPANESVHSVMPNWTELIDTFCDKLGIPNDNDSRKYLSTLSIAQEIEDTYGRPFLDQMIANAMNDDAYIPSDIHISLMSLPWTDVFTTNYDTLLERAASQVAVRKYYPIYDQRDLLYSSGKHRIIKLHGSIPSHKPYIITEEDFRRYPYDNAPFVNTVQQSLLENTFCLVGFSGDDPNFLKWIGWIHDNLGLKNSPKIFLITKQAPSAAKIKNLNGKNIELVVLDDLVDDEEYQEFCVNDSVKESFRKLFKHIATEVKNRKQQMDNWPNGLIQHPVYSNGNEEKCYQLLKKIHGLYPGWIIVPFKKYENISRILFDLSEFEIGIERKEKKFEFEITYEYCWLSSIIARPLFEDDLQWVSAVVHRYEKKINDDPLFKSNDKLYRFILLYMLRSYRINELDKEWRNTYEKLKALKLEIEEKNQLVYEDILHDIYQLRFDNIGKKAETIVTDQNQSVWALRKAGFLAMEGSYSEAKSIIQDALHIIRKNISTKTEEHNYRYLSIESCLVSLFNYIIQVENFESMTSGNPEEFEEEHDKNGSVNFIWRDQNDHYEDILSDQYVFEPQSGEHPTFDIGRITYHSTIGALDKNALHAYEFLGFRELTGIPFRLGNVVSKKGSLGAAKRICPYSQMYPLILAVLADDVDIIKKVCNREYIASISAEKINNLGDSCITSMTRAMDLFASTGKSWYVRNIRDYPLNIMPEVLSRLSSRCSDEKHEALVILLEKMYLYSHKDGIGNISSYVMRLINTISVRMLLDNIDVFLALPVFSENALENNNFPECFIYIFDRLSNLIVDSDGKFKKLQMSKKGEASLEQLLAQTNDPELRRPVIRRLTYIFQLFNLNKDDKEKIREVISSPENMRDGIPYLGDFYSSTIAEFLGTDDSIAGNKTESTKQVCHEGTFNSSNDLDDLIGEESAKKLVNQTIENSRKKLMANVKHAAEESSNTDYSEMLRNGISIANRYNFSEEEILELARELTKLCKKVIKGINDGFPITIGFGKVSSEGTLRYSGELLGECILKAQLATEDTCYQNEQAVELYDVLHDNKAPCSLLGWCVNKNDRETILKHGLFDGSNKKATEAANAIVRLTHYGIPVSDEIIRLLVDALITTDSYTIGSYVLALEFLIQKGKVSDKQEQEIADSLPKIIELTRFDENDDEQDAANKVFYRRTASMLAHRMYCEFIDKGQTIPDGVMAWKKLSESSEEFAEVRNCWEELDDLLSRSNPPEISVHSDPER